MNCNMFNWKKIRGNVDQLVDGGFSAGWGWGPLGGVQNPGPGGGLGGVKIPPPGVSKLHRKIHFLNNPPPPPPPPPPGGAPDPPHPPHPPGPSPRVIQVPDPG